MFDWEAASPEERRQFLHEIVHFAHLKLGVVEEGSEVVISHHVRYGGSNDVVAKDRDSDSDRQSLGHPVPR